MAEKVINNIAEKYENIKKEVTKVMGGQVLEYEAKRILRQGIEQGIEQGIAQAAYKMLKNGTTCQEVARILELEVDAVERLCEEMEKEL